MDHYSYQKSLRGIWTDAVERYRKGQREPETFFSAETLESLASIGLGTMDVYDFAEDFAGREEPDFETFLMICEARRDYFFTVQKGEPSTDTLDVSTIPGKEVEVRGIVWLPRIIPKALAKLRGELPADTMYCCGGDRRFFRDNHIHPAEFLRVVWAYQQEEAKIIDWVEARRTTATAQSPSA